MNVEIKNRFTGKIIISGEYESIKDCLKKKGCADLTNADLTGAVLTSADLTGAVLTGADLTGADLTGAVLTGAVLTSADLTGADLTGAILTGADLTGAILTGAEYVDCNGVKFKIKIIYQLLGLYYEVYFFATHMRIGCKCYKYVDWWKFDDERILKMDGKDAKKFWDKNKNMLQDISRSLKGTK